MIVPFNRVAKTLPVELGYVDLVVLDKASPATFMMALPALLRPSLVAGVRVRPSEIYHFSANELQNSKIRLDYIHYLIRNSEIAAMTEKEDIWPASQHLTPFQRA